PAHYRARALWEPPGRSVQHLEGIEGPGEGAADPRAGAEPVDARAGARRTRAAAFGFARVWRHRTGCRRRDVHLPSAFLQGGGDTRRTGRDGASDCQAEEWTDRPGEVCVSEPVHAV